jgi:hypothetical protein
LIDDPLPFSDSSFPISALSPDVRSCSEGEVLPVARKYDPKLVFEIWMQIKRGRGFQGRFPKKKWDQKVTIKQALDCLDAIASQLNL